MRKVEVSAEFVLEAYRAACQTWKDKIKEEIGPDFKKLIGGNGRPRKPIKGDFLTDGSATFIVEKVVNGFQWDANHQLRPMNIGGKLSRGIGHPDSYSRECYYGSHDIRFATPREIEMYLSTLHSKSSELTPNKSL